MHSLLRKQKVGPGMMPSFWYSAVRCLSKQTFLSIRFVRGCKWCEAYLADETFRKLVLKVRNALCTYYIYIANYMKAVNLSLETGRRVLTWNCNFLNREHWRDLFAAVSCGFEQTKYFYAKWTKQICKAQRLCFWAHKSIESSNTFEGFMYYFLYSPTTNPRLWWFFFI